MSEEIYKYLVKMQFDVNGIVEKPDVIGAIFSYSEGLLGPSFDLRELQKTNRIGRIEVDLSVKDSKTTGFIKFQSNMDMPSTALLISLLESVEKVGPYKARFRLVSIEDARHEKLKSIVSRAKEIVSQWVFEKAPDLEELLKEIRSGVKIDEPVPYGPDKLPAGPDVDKSSEVIVVEGRADVINLMRRGFRNVIALEGAKITETIKELASKKIVTAFIDGDRSGDLLLKELLQSVKVDYVARAPRGKEVEELTGEEIRTALANRKPVGGVEIKPAVRDTVSKYSDLINDLTGTLEAVLLDPNDKPIARVPVSELVEKLKGELAPVKRVVFDGVITQRLVDVAAEKGVELIIGQRMGSVEKRPPNVILVALEEPVKQQ